MIPLRAGSANPSRGEAFFCNRSFTAAREIRGAGS
jgi:hypothetical protein